MSDTSIPVKYILYSHYGYEEKGDFEAYKKGAPPEQLRGVDYLCSHLRALRDLLSWSGHEGLLVLFYAPGYERFLKALARNEEDASLLADGYPTDDERQQLRFASTVAHYVRQKLRENQLDDRVRFLTSLDLRQILGRVNSIDAHEFERFFIGPARGVRYDSPKVVEAILRLRVLGNGVPVLRLDHDVIFRGENKDTGDLGLFKAVERAVHAYHLRLDRPDVSTFLFSASYDSQVVCQQRPKGVSGFESWSRAFATRIYPALLADVNDISDIVNSADANPNDRWVDYVNDERHWNEALACRFYGVRKAGTRLEADGTSGLASVGAHPLYAVISGALLCLSEGAILDLPPFSNMGTNVMWIDDHLKYSLHRAMRHFTSGETLHTESGLGDARLDNVVVVKGRQPVSNLPQYVFGIYLPTLLWGTIMDRWITQDPILKCRYSELDETGRTSWKKAERVQDKAPLPDAMRTALSAGTFDRQHERELGRKLTLTAIERIDEVRRLWAGLATDGQRTFASYWAEGDVKRAFGKCFEGHKGGGLWQGITEGRPLSKRISQLSDLNEAVRERVIDLVDDTLDYVHWTLEWPRFVQIVRSIDRGSFSGDLTWQSPKETAEEAATGGEEEARPHVEAAGSSETSGLVRRVKKAGDAAARGSRRAEKGR